MDRDLSALDVYNLDSGEIETHDELLTVVEASKIFSKVCTHCNQQMGLSYQQIMKAVRAGRVPAYDRFGGKRSMSRRDKVYVNYYDIQKFYEKQKRIKSRSQRDD